MNFVLIEACMHSRIQFLKITPPPSPTLESQMDYPELQLENGNNKPLQIKP